MVAQKIEDKMIQRECGTLLYRVLLLAKTSSHVFFRVD